MSTGQVVVIHKRGFCMAGLPVLIGIAFAIKNAQRMEQGNHDELMKGKASCWRLYNSKFSFLEAI